MSILVLQNQHIQITAGNLVHWVTTKGISVNSLFRPFLDRPIDYYTLLDFQYQYILLLLTVKSYFVWDIEWKSVSRICFQHVSANFNCSLFICIWCATDYWLIGQVTVGYFLRYLQYVQGECKLTTLVHGCNCLWCMAKRLWCIPSF